MSNRTPVEWWDTVDTELPIPGSIADRCLGIDGPAEALPEGDAEREDEDT